MLNYAQVREESYYARNYAGIMCQGLTTKGDQGQGVVVQEQSEANLGVQ